MTLNQNRSSGYLAGKFTVGHQAAGEGDTAYQDGQDDGHDADRHRREFDGLGKKGSTVLHCPECSFWLFLRA